MLHKTLFLATLTFLGCVAHWSPPKVEGAEGKDGRDCSSTSCVDVAVLVDTSASMGGPMGGPDWTVKGEIFGYPTGGTGSKLWVALDGLENATADLDARRVAMMVIGFAGDPYQEGPSTWTEVTLSNNVAELFAAASRIRSREAAGWSCQACAVRIGGEALADSARRGRCPVLILLTDSDSNLPVRPPEADLEAKNRQEIVKVLENLWPRVAAFVLVGEGNLERAKKFEREVVAVGSRVTPARGSSDIGQAIANAVESCSRSAEVPAA